MLRTEAWLDEKPYREVYDGAVHEKVSAQAAHGVLQPHIAALLIAWGDDRGIVATELRVFLDERTTLVPDVCFITGERFSRLTGRDRRMPPFAPELTIEIRSPDDREKRIRRKTDLYIEHGAIVVLNVDPDERIVRMTTAEDERTLRGDDVIEHSAFPDLAITVRRVFAPLDRLGL